MNSNNKYLIEMFLFLTVNLLEDETKELPLSDAR
jgi:hypothetical protein